MTGSNLAVNCLPIDMRFVSMLKKRMINQPMLLEMIL